VAAASTRYACRQPSRSISTSATGGPTSVPAPIPLTAMPIASDRRRPNQPPTAATIGTYAHAVPTPTPSPYVRHPSQNAGVTAVSARPRPIAAAPTSTTRRGPTRSATAPLTAPRLKKLNAVTANSTDVSPWPVWNSRAIGSKNAPKL